ncbi:dihydroxyacetone kinase subunit DhaL [Sinomonas sp. G460-2]|uniref:dihydroxyacetone kinase subunit DhaL n=1 Tax=unclassified Sinomonas TaxID=2646595 RepID=UPI0039EF63F1
METLNTGLATENLRRWVLDFAHGILDEHEALSDLDSASGDADHGSNMHRGMSGLLRVIPEWGEEALPGEFLKGVGMHIVSSVGGSSGALYGTIFLRMARTVGGASALDAQLLVRAFESAGEGVAERGKVKQGDKTMYDALAPAIHTLREQVEAGEASLSAALEAAAAAAEAGRDATADMVARKGKSSYARENSRGVIDPGAASVAMLMRSAARALP